MRFILGLLGLLAIVAAGIIGYNWLMGNNQVKIVTPSNNSTLYTDSVRVQLATSDSTQAKLVESGPEYLLVTFLDGREVHRGKELAFDVPNVKAGNHELKIGIVNRTQNMLDNISLQPNPVKFSVSASATHVDASDYSVASVNNGQVRDYLVPGSQAQPVVDTPTPEPQPTPAPVAALPASGAGGGNRVLNSSAANLNASATNRNLAVNFNEPGAIQAPPETPMQSVFRSLIAFYVASFIVGLAFIVISFRRRRRRKIIWERKA